MTLHAQQTSLYLLDGEIDPNPRKHFIRDLLTLITTAKDNNQDIILIGDFNEVVGDDPKMSEIVLVAGNLTDAHAHKHDHANIATYIRGRHRVDYCFVSLEYLNTSYDVDLKQFMLEKCVIIGNISLICQ